MGWMIEQKNDRYRIYSETIRGYLMGWSSRDEVVKRIIKNKYREFMTDVIKQYMTFPHHWRKETGTIYVDRERCDKHSDWVAKLCKTPAIQYYEEIDDTFQEALAELGIEPNDFKNLADLIDGI